MTISTITSKGQITIPKAVRERLHLEAGDRVDFYVEQDGSVRMRPLSKTVDEVFGAFSYKASRPHSTVEMKRKVAETIKRKMK